jgi:hypothetical protein
MQSKVAQNMPQACWKNQIHHHLRIDSEISQLGLAIKAAETRIKSWRKELTQSPASGK